LTTINRSNYINDNADVRALLKKLPMDDFYRIDKVTRKTKDDGAWMNFRSVSIFSSTANAALSDLFENSKIESEEKKSEISNTFNLQTEFIKNNISIPENITFLNTLKKKDFKELKNIYVEYLPLENKIKLKEKLDNGEPVYSDYSVVEII